MANVEKSDGAFRTIREVADWLAVPTHVLRFWESKFAQIAPVKGAGGRRYYRPEDMRLLGGIKVMLHDQGLTVRGVGQRIDNDGVDAVMELSPDLDTGGKAPPAARRVIRPGEDAAARMTPPASRTGVSAPPPEESLPDVDPAGTDSAPDPDASQPDAPDLDEQPRQPKDVDAPPQPIEDAPVPAEDEPQPEPDDESPQAPGSDPEPIPTDERGIETERKDAAPSPVEDEAPAELTDGDAAPGVIPAEDMAPTEPSLDDTAPEPAEPLEATRAGKPVLDPLKMRSLRRVIRRLRTLIEDVEKELGDVGPPR